MTKPEENRTKASLCLQKVVVIGAGPAGLTAAYQLQANGLNVELFEAQTQVGGLCKSFEIWGHTVDLGPHRFFSSSDDVNQFWFQAVGKDFSWVPRQTRIFYKKSYFRYPLQAWDTFLNLGLEESLFSFTSYLWAKISFKKSDDNFENWVIARFGQRLYEIFFKTYSEKLWGLPCSHIDPDFAFRKIRGLSLLEVFKRFFKKRPTFVDQFAYPQRGTGSVYETIANRFIQKGGTLKLQSPVNDLTRFKDCTLISTMPLPQLIRLLPNVPQVVQDASVALEFRNTVLVYLWLEGKNLFPDNWIYVHSPDVQFGRVTNFSNWSMEKNIQARGTVLCLEYWCSEQDDQWKWSDEQWGGLGKNELINSQIAPAFEKILDSKVIRVPRSYPVFKKGYQTHLNVIKEYLKKNHPHIYTIGRYGSFKYNNQDHSILMGLRAADIFLKKYKGTLENINSDTKYEEDVELKDISYESFDEV